MQFAHSRRSRGSVVGLLGLTVGSLFSACAGEHYRGGTGAVPPTIDAASPSSGSGGAQAGSGGGSPIGGGAGGTITGGDGSGGAGDGGASGSGGAIQSPDSGSTGGAPVVDAAPDVPAGVDAGSADVALRLPAPPATWLEHWFEHNQTLDLIAYNDDAVVYFDKDVVRAGTDWILPFATSAWQYTRRTYGDFQSATSDGRFYAIFHQGRYNGCHAGLYMDAAHDYRNASDCGPGPWATPDPGDPAFQLSVIVENSSNGVSGSPGGAVWGFYHFAEFFRYDLFVALGRTADAQSAYDAFVATTDAAPQTATYWFRDWFYPLWRDHGHGQVMAKFFKLLSQYFPKSQGKYSRGLTFAEMVHFMSGAAGANLKAQAVTAFGPNFPTDADFAKARSDFPQVTY